MYKIGLFSLFMAFFSGLSAQTLPEQVIIDNILLEKKKVTIFATVGIHAVHLDVIPSGPLYELGVAYRGHVSSFISAGYTAYQPTSISEYDGAVRRVFRFGLGGRIMNEGNLYVTASLHTDRNSGDGAFTVGFVYDQTLIRKKDWSLGFRGYLEFGEFMHTSGSLYTGYRF